MNRRKFISRYSTALAGATGFWFIGKSLFLTFSKLSLSFKAKKTNGHFAIIFRTHFPKGKNSESFTEDLKIIAQKHENHRILKEFESQNRLLLHEVKKSPFHNDFLLVFDTKESFNQFKSQWTQKKNIRYDRMADLGYTKETLYI